MKYKLIQEMYPCDQPWTEHFFDGEARVQNNIVEVDRDYHRDTLLTRGFVNYTEPDEDEGEETPPAPKKRAPRKQSA